MVSLSHGTSVNFLRLQIEISYYILTIDHLLEFESALEVISIGHFEFQLMTMFYYSILRLRLENSFHLCHSIHIKIFSHPVMVSFFLSDQWCFSTVNVVDCYFLGYLLDFLIDHECDHSLELLLTYELLF